MARFVRPSILSKGNYLRRTVALSKSGHIPGFFQMYSILAKSGCVFWWHIAKWTCFGFFSSVGYFFFFCSFSFGDVLVSYSVFLGSALLAKYVKSHKEFDSGFCWLSMCLHTFLCAVIMAVCWPYYPFLFLFIITDKTFKQTKFLKKNTSLPLLEDLFWGKKGYKTLVLRIET